MLVKMVRWMMSRADVGADGKKRLRDVQGEACKAPWDGVRRGGLVGKGGEKEDHSQNCHACGRMGFSWA